MTRHRAFRVYFAITFLLSACSSSHQGSRIQDEPGIDGGECAQPPCDGAQPGMTDGGMTDAAVATDCRSDDDCPGMTTCEEDGSCLSVPGSSVPVVSPSDTHRECTSDKECVPFPMDCCGCGGQIGHYAGVTRESIPELRAQCDNITCLCIGIQPIRPAATCLEGQCEAVDLNSYDPVVGCVDHGDCSMRAAVCCECDATLGDEFVSVSDPELYGVLKCLPDDSCDSSCDPFKPETAEPFCDRGVCRWADPTL